MLYSIYLVEIFSAKEDVFCNPESIVQILLFIIPVSV